MRNGRQGYSCDSLDKFWDVLHLGLWLGTCLCQLAMWKLRVLLYLGNLGHLDITAVLCLKESKMVCSQHSVFLDTPQSPSPTPDAENKGSE